jgi:hypothetical protein
MSSNRWYELRFLKQLLRTDVVVDLVMTMSLSPLKSPESKSEFAWYRQWTGARILSESSCNGEVLCRSLVGGRRPRSSRRNRRFRLRLSAISLNFSPAALLEGCAAATLVHVGRKILIEVTEHARIDNFAAVQWAVDEIEGCRLAVDVAGAR